MMVFKDLLIGIKHELDIRGWMMKFIDLNQQQERIRMNIDKRIQTVLNHGKYIMGPEVFELEESLVLFSGANHCITCSSGTDALLMALMAWNIGPGDAVLTTPFTFIATSEVIRLLGATPVFVDIEKRTFNIDPVDLENKIIELNGNSDLTPRVVIPVDLFGLPADYPEIIKIGSKYGLKVLGDGAQSFGAEIAGKKVHSMADAFTTSFFPAKPLGCYGDGGAIFTNDDNLAEVLKSIRVHGKGGHKYDNVRTGINGRLDTLQAAILLEKLAIFPGEIESRGEVANKYTRKIGESLKTPFIPEGFRSVWAQYSVLAGSANEREKVQVVLKENDIPSVIYYPKPLHLQTAYSDLGYKAGDFPVSEDISGKVFSLPMHPYLESASISKIVDVIRGHNAR